MRGTLDFLDAYRDASGIIPAHAGNTRKSCNPSPAFPGSSPRMRGTLRSARHARLYAGIIPAHAGNTEASVFLRHVARDHPRACGEHHQPIKLQGIELGSSPRMRGTLGDSRVSYSSNGIIPAHAGNTNASSTRSRPPGDHPRACGEHLFQMLWKKSQRGSSPRMRGTLARYESRLYRFGIIPAHAGNTRLHVPLFFLPWDHPRACGEHIWQRNWT